VKWVMGLATTAMLAAPALGRDSLGIYEGWGAFRDSSPKRCYAISQPTQGEGSKGPYATLSWWPEKAVKGQFHAKLSRTAKAGSAAYLVAAGRRWRMKAEGRNMWGPSARHDAFIFAALRSASGMTISGTAENGDRFADRYALKGAASAFDAAALGCAKGQ
jgi:hypothetical protein